MEKLLFKYELSEAQAKQKENLVKNLLENQYIIQFMKDFQVDEQFVYMHSGKLSDYCVIKAKCERCKSKNFCTQPVKGYYLNCYYDKILMHVLTPCKYQKDDTQAFAHIKYYLRFDAPRDFGLIDLKQTNVSEERIDYINCFEKALSVCDGENEKGLFLCGKPGVGKTYLACGITNHFAKEHTKVAFINVPNWIGELKRNMQDASAFDHMIQITRKAEVLVLDDIGGESVTNWSRDDIVLPLLESRMKDQKCTIFTSNYRMSELKERYALFNQKGVEPIAAERIMERIKTLSSEIFMLGETRRK